MSVFVTLLRETWQLNPSLQKQKCNPKSIMWNILLINVNWWLRRRLMQYGWMALQDNLDLPSLRNDIPWLVLTSSVPFSKTSAIPTLSLLLAWFRWLHSLLPHKIFLSYSQLKPTLLVNILLGEVHDNIHAVIRAQFLPSASIVGHIRDQNFDASCQKITWLIIHMFNLILLLIVWTILILLIYFNNIFFNTITFQFS